jgi:hypothetical protein
VAWSVGYQQNDEKILLSSLARLIKSQQALHEVNLFTLGNKIKFGLP